MSSVRYIVVTLKMLWE